MDLFVARVMEDAMQLAKKRTFGLWQIAGFTLVLGICAVSDALGQQYQGSPTQTQQPQYRTQQGVQQRTNAQQVPASQVGYQRPVQGGQAAGQVPNTNQGTPGAQGGRQGYPGASVQPQGQQIPIVKPQQAVQQGNAQVARSPFPPLTAQEQQYLDQVLNVWQQKTAAIKQYECKFIRWQHDPTINKTAANTIAKGEIKYMKPDKGLFKVTDLQFADGTGPQPNYRPDPRRPHGEHWICDGDWIHILDANEKKVVRQQLPPNMQGTLIHRSPLPFLFGVNAQEMKARYWIRPIRPPQGSQDVWLEAWPRWADDAGNYSRVQVIISRTDTLPSGMIVFLPNYRAEQPHREIYEFKDRKIPGGLGNMIKQNIFMQQFIPKGVPADWKIIEDPYVPPEEQKRVASQQPGQPANGVPR